MNLYLPIAFFMAWVDDHNAEKWVSYHILANSNHTTKQKTRQLKPPKSLPFEQLKKPMAGSNCFNNVFCMWKLFFGQFCSRFWHHWTSWQRNMLVYPLVIWHTYWNMVIYSCFNLLKLTFYSYQPVDWRLNIQGTYRRKLAKSSSSKTSMGIVSKSCGDASLRYRVRSLASGEHVGSKPPTFLGIVWDCICDYMCTYVCMCPHVSTYNDIYVHYTPPQLQHRSEHRQFSINTQQRIIYSECKLLKCKALEFEQQSKITVL